jgi:predicted nucleotidyltransferase
MWSNIDFLKLFCYVIFMQINDPIVTRFRRELTATYGARLERVVLFGSRARGDAAPDSDYDVAVFLKDMSDRWSEIDRLAALRLPYLERDDAFLDVMPYHAEDYNKQTGLMHSIRTEGITV